MRDADRKEFKQLVSDVMAYYRQDTSTFTYNVFWESLHSFELQAVRAAFNAHARDADRGRFAPKVADILGVLGASEKPEIKAQRAWAKVRDAVSSVGADRNIVFDDPIIHAALRDIGGYRRLCREYTETMPFRAREFEKAYCSYASSNAPFEYPALIRGESQFEDIETVMLGNPAAAQHVLLNGLQANASPIKAIASVAAALIANTAR